MGANSFTKRKAERQKAEFMVKTQQTERREPTTEELTSLIEAISRNKHCQFGVVKMSTLSLDVPFPAPWRKVPT